MYIKPKKKLGQNFLLDKNIQHKIIAACDFKSVDCVLEIGAGRGELTKLIAEKVAKVYALEIDPDLCGFLKEHLKEYKNVIIVNQDILKFNFKTYFKNRVKVLGNIPYYISTAIIEHLFKFRQKIETAFITVQKEFAARITAVPGSKDYGSLSCFVQYYANPKRLFIIKKNSFFPAPKVDSAFLKIEMKREASFKPKEEELLFKIIRQAFAQRRKTLRNSLRETVSKPKLGKFFAKYNINPNIRPEDLTLSDFKNLASL